MFNVLYLGGRPNGEPTGRGGGCSHACLAPVSDKEGLEAAPLIWLGGRQEGQKRSGKANWVLGGSQGYFRRVWMPGWCCIASCHCQDSSGGPRVALPRDVHLTTSSVTLSSRQCLASSLKREGCIREPLPETGMAEEEVGIT